MLEGFITSVLGPDDIGIVMLYSSLEECVCVGSSVSVLEGGNANVDNVWYKILMFDGGKMLEGFITSVLGPDDIGIVMLYSSLEECVCVGSSVSVLEGGNANVDNVWYKILMFDGGKMLEGFITSVLAPDDMGIVMLYSSLEECACVGSSVSVLEGGNANVDNVWYKILMFDGGKMLEGFIRNVLAPDDIGIVMLYSSLEERACVGSSVSVLEGGNANVDKAWYNILVFNWGKTLE